MKKTMLTLSAVAWSLVLGSAFAAGPEKGGKAPAQKAKAAEAEAAPKMDPAQQAMMEKMMKMGTPGENHRVLDAFVGKWNCTVKNIMNPGDKPQESKGTSESKWIMGGRFLEQDFNGEPMMGMGPFQGLGITGYDNMKGEYNSIWLDNMGTGMMTSRSSYNAAAKTIEETGSFSCPVTGEKEKRFTGGLKIIDHDHYTYEMYFTGHDGKPFKSLEINYVRAK